MRISDKPTRYFHKVEFSVSDSLVMLLLGHRFTKG